MKKSTQEVVRRSRKLWTNQERNYQLIDILEITDRVKKSDMKKEKRDPHYSHAVAKLTADTKAFGGSDLSY